MYVCRIDVKDDTKKKYIIKIGKWVIFLSKKHFLLMLLLPLNDLKRFELIYIRGILLGIVYVNSCL